MTRGTLWSRSLPVLAILLLAGCSAPRRGIAPAAPAALTGPSPGPPSYRLVPGDVLDVKFYYNPGLNESLTVRPDGYVSLQLVGDVRASGLTPGELSAQLRADFSKHLPDPEVSVILRTFAAQQIYVGGEVGSPGTCELHGRLTCAQALFSRGGARRSARLSQVLVLRHAGPDSTVVRMVDLDRVFNGEGPDLVLEPWDVVYVPKTAIAGVGQFVDQFINDIVPRSLSFPYSLNSHITVQ